MNGLLWIAWHTCCEQRCMVRLSICMSIASSLLTLVDIGRFRPLKSACDPAPDAPLGSAAAQRHA